MSAPDNITDLPAIRHYLHANPELGLEEFKTSDYLSDLLNNSGLEVTRSIGGTGLVASLRRGDGDKAIGLRADMDALPMAESTGKSYTSCSEDRMHACGHDGHMTMLLGAAHNLANDPEFSGNVHFIFQPAEENIGGAKLMLNDGLFEQFPCDMIFALHNMPGLPVGKFTSCEGPIAASIDAATVTIKGKGGHGAQPENTVDPIVIGAQIVSSFQTVVSRNLGPFAPAVVTVGAFNSGSVSNIIPEVATLELSLRATTRKDRKLMMTRLVDLAEGIATGFGGSVEFEWQPGYPVTVNAPQAVKLARQAAIKTSGSDHFEWMEKPLMGSEDFSFMLEKVQGALMFTGNGDSASLHSPKYDFNDDVLPIGVEYFSNLARFMFNS
ncbi:MAG: M20 aminoacylase family protein [Desulforhopalus sp.]